MKKHYYLIGIGGIGLSGIAKILLKNGNQVSGSDINSNDQTKELEKLGAKIYYKQVSLNISRDINAVVASSAIPDDNEEMLAAKDLKIPIYKRNDFLKVLTKNYKVIAVAGTHGKTTTSAMTTHLLKTAGIDPTYLVGGVLNNYGTNSDAGKSDYFVIEADEYDWAFWGLNPYISLVNNIHYDHPDIFKDENHYLEAFQGLADRIKENGYLIKNKTDKLSNKLNFSGKIIEFDDNSDYQIANFQPGLKSKFKIQHKNKIVNLSSSLFGRHNTINWLGVYAIAQILDIADDVFVKAVKTFKGAERRMQQFIIDGNYFYSDYAHHPDEIKAVLESLSGLGKDIIAIYQPHQISRTKTLVNDYENVFDKAAKVILLPFYVVREDPDQGFKIEDLKNKINNKNIEIEKNLENVDKDILDNLSSQNIVVLMTAGDAHQKAVEKLNLK